MFMRAIDFNALTAGMAYLNRAAQRWLSLKVAIRNMQNQSASGANSALSVISIYPRTLAQAIVQTFTTKRKQFPCRQKRDVLR